MDERGEYEKFKKSTGLTTKGPVMSKDLERKVDAMTALQKRYAEYRAKGLKQADAAQKAGSTAKDRGALSRTGWSFEQVDGMKEYIAFLFEKRSAASMVDTSELMDKLRDNYEEAMDRGRVDWANKAVELMALISGIMKQGTSPAVKDGRNARKEGATTKNNVEAFKEGLVEIDDPNEARLKQIKMLMSAMKGIEK